MQHNSERVLEPRGVDSPGRANESSHPLRQTEEMHHLVQEVGAEIVNGRTTGDDLVLPLVGVGGRLLGTVAVEMGFELGDAAKRAVANQFGEGDVVGVEAAVCKDGLDASWVVFWKDVLW